GVAGPGRRREPTLPALALAERRAGCLHGRDGVSADLPPGGRPAASPRGDDASRGLEGPRLEPARLALRGDLRRRGVRLLEVLLGEAVEVRPPGADLGGDLARHVLP